MENSKRRPLIGFCRRQTHVEHGEQKVCPVPLVTIPISQSVQAWLPAWFAKVPVAQSSQPSCSLGAASIVPRVPGGHGVQVTAPWPPYFPLGHGVVQEVCPLLTLWYPGSQLRQFELPFAFWNWPGGHCVHAEDDVAPEVWRNLPAAHSEHPKYPESAWNVPGGQVWQLALPPVIARM